MDTDLGSGSWGFRPRGGKIGRMERERHQRIKDIVYQAAQYSAADRERLIQQACGDDEELHREVQTLLRFADTPNDPFRETVLRGGRDQLDVLLDAGQAGSSAPDRAAAFGHDRLDEVDSVPASIGRYAIIRLLGQGGMGRVYLAEQEQPRRHVAVKILRHALAGERARQRFAFEATALGRLEHVGIARIYDAGTADVVGPANARRVLASDQPFMAMEFIEGQNLTQYAGAKKLELRQKLTLMASICDAVHYAHQNAVIHRDLKPANVLIAVDGQPKVIDFGVARAMDADVRLTHVQSDAGPLIGTLAYMSPEQIEGNPRAVDALCDVYALGVMLYQLLAGRLPYNLERRPCHAAILAIQQDEPGALGVFDRRLRGDVETIVLKALRKDKRQRYDSAAALAEDIRRFLRHEPIAARAPSATYRLSKFARRNKTLVGGGLAVFVALVAGMVTTLSMYFRAEEQRHQTEQVARFQETQLSGIDAATMGVKLRADLLTRARAAAERSKRSPEEVEGRIAELEQLIADTDFTGLALNALDTTVFQRALAAIDNEFADPAAGESGTTGKGQALIRARLLQSLAVTMRELGLVDGALRAQEEALAIRRYELGDDHPDTLNAIGNMGTLLHYQGKRAEAELFHREALEKRRRVLGAESAETLESINNMGSLLQAGDNLDAAEPYFREALETSRRVLGGEHPITLQSLNNMGVLRQAQRRPGEAEPFLREYLDISRRVLGEEHPYTLKAFNNMGYLLQSQGRLAEAEPYLRETLEKARRVLGDDHSRTLSAVNNMGFLLQAQGKLADAEVYYREALAGRRRILGDDHPNTVNSISNMGALLEAQGNLAESETYRREALDRSRSALGDEHPTTLNLLSNLGGVLFVQGKPAEAEPYFREGLERWRKRTDPNPAAFASALANLGRTVLVLQRFDEAEPLIRECLEIRERILPESNPLRWQTQCLLGEALAGLGRFGEAEHLLLDAWEHLRPDIETPKSTGGNDGQRKLLARFVKLYEAWDASEPGAGHDAAAREWAAKLQALDSGQPAP